MKLARWALPVVLRVLSLAGLTSAGGGSVMIGLALSSTPISAQPPHQQSPVNLELNFFLKVADKELKLPVLPITWGTTSNKTPSQRSLEAPPTTSPSIKHQRTLTAPENTQKLLEYYPSTSTASEPIPCPLKPSSSHLKHQRVEDVEDQPESKQHPKKKSKICNSEGNSDENTEKIHQTPQKIVKYVPKRQRLSPPSSALLAATSTAVALIATKSTNKNDNKKRKLKTFQYETEDEADDDMSDLDTNVARNVGSREVYTSRQVKRRRGNENKEVSQQARRLSRYRDGEVKKWSSERMAFSSRR